MNKSNKIIKWLGAAFLFVGIVLLIVSYSNSYLEESVEEPVDTLDSLSPATSAPVVSTTTSSSSGAPASTVVPKANSNPLKIVNVKIECTGGDLCNPPIISAIAEKNVSESGVVISWTTSQPATTVIFYSTSTPFLKAGKTMTVSSASLSKAHQIDMGFLEANTTYYYILQSANQAGFSATSSVRSFTTLAGQGRLF